MHTAFSEKHDPISLSGALTSSHRDTLICPDSIELQVPIKELHNGVHGTTLTTQKTRDEPTSSVPNTSSDLHSSRTLSRTRSVVVVATMTGLMVLNSMGSGILIAATPRIASDLGLSQAMILWPAAVYSLAAGCLLLIFGAAADAIGVKQVWLAGGFLYTFFTLAIGFAQTGAQMIAFRALSGVAIAMCMPTSVSLITNTFPSGPWRNTAFAMNGMGQPLGYAVGLVLGGILTDTVGWRWAYYMMTIVSFCLTTAAFGALPRVPRHSDKPWRQQLLEDIDWIGAFVMSAGLGLLFYALATVASSYESIRSAKSIAILILSIGLLAAFPFWMQFCERHHRPALIPNKLWQQASFTTACIAVFVCWASLIGIEYFTMLYFQQVEGITALQASIRFLGEVVTGIVGNIATAYLVSVVEIRYLAVVTALVTMVGPPLMATVEIGENYWYRPFWALLLAPVNTDVLFTVSNLIIADAFPGSFQSLAGGVFTEVTQLGNACGLAVTAAIAASVSDRQTQASGTELSLAEKREALMTGFRAVFWTVFAGTSIVAVVCSIGFRRGGIVGKKRD
ncbi:unnamed protein product [Zymoseptoria tritici ST99CH_1E4]|uniref:Major facilitator superfamily (MFS) profile domain-containing protein n=1 Tax=Zymoseptoria tritici ST99CH_1E4 TaxID=1276532 RepID=A0A2H1GYQ5_ZYMTR|nr:unnamed protein product [Zymoseptoria tritici ST99CH_1E4]